ncbi:phosphate ABC transporter substrate-binding protein PstS family protein [Vagococcus xieshaowenii]|uniref:Phosphate-binding protein n=1 Tax=Vagococcus xieshaowenii TaxID=2562451 RepID=A0AAJ5EER3_9ENTE|nr:phosphate ABC transporter substrate-binding protein PstS family protein [Vagococcus xieshaowenii]QCA28599.1 phosphate ABC transporter substrate-binding protein PstS family protein [Vagococcus xieshaowenii]TFZ40593.1 phosphate ABC transporter substrate-binding protein PstS family protein [Vagococcus xieshaowenii]
MKKNLLIMAGVSFVFLLTGCGSTSGKTSEEGKKQTEIVAVGSTALQPLVDKIKDIYQTDFPEYNISVQGGGSGTGLSQVSSGAVDIGNSDVFAEEKDGIDADKIVDNKVAVVGIGPVINKEVKVDNLTRQQLIDIFTGKVKNWKEVGGQDLEIVVVNRAEGSGTRATFEKWGLDGTKTIGTQEQDSSGTVKKIITQTPGAISYLAFSYFDDTFKALKIDGVEPTVENVTTNDWTIWAYEHMYISKDASEDVKTFIEYCLSDDVQKNVVEQLNYIPMTKMTINRDVEGNVTPV